MGSKTSLDDRHRSGLPPLPAPLMACLSLAACNHVPSQNLLGSFFPSWMLCVLIGIPAALLVRLVLVKAGVDDAVPAKLPVYSALAVAVTFGLWLVLFGN